VRAPVELFRYELLVRLQPVPDDVLQGIVDDVFLPLVNLGASRQPGPLPSP
jgi:hypothetical protein